MAEDLSKLPKWAQSRLAVAERRIADLLAQRVALAKGETNTWVRDDASTFGSKIFLPESCTVVFETPDGETVQCRMMGDKEAVKGLLNVNASNALKVQANAANSVYIEVPSRFK